ncbi:MAG: efflux RND transporter permease subunit, partial [Gammaproteobacteria bacterium]|nr:efflux RND transporter permease subunit [Gammaproteobacteria bacterium]
MEALLRFFIQRHLLVNVIAAGLIVMGYLSATSIPREFIPTVQTPIFWLTAMLPGAAAQDVEAKVTIPIEEALEEVEGIDEFTSVIADNTSFTTIELHDDYNEAQTEAAETDLRAALEAITDFPDEMEDEPVLKQFNPARLTVVEIALEGPEQALAQTARTVEERLERLPLIASVHPVGLPDPEVRVLVDPVRAREHGITLTDVIAAVRDRNVSSTGGMLESPDERRQVVMWSRFDEPEKVGEAILRFDAEGGALRIADIARIESGREDTGMIAHTNGQRGVTLLVQKRETADLVDAVEQVRAELASMDIADEVRLSLTNDESVIVDNRLELMATNGLIGLVLVTAVLFTFVRPGPAAWIIVGIPIVFLAALILFPAFGMTMNIMALTGLVIVLGMVVDDAVVVSERIVVKQAQGLESGAAALAGAKEMLAPVTAAALTTVLAFAPLTAIGGLPGKIVWQIPVVVIIVLVFSLIESFLILPAHMSTLKSGAGLQSRRFVRTLEAHYRTALAWVLKHRAVTLVAAFAAFAAIMGIIRPLVPFTLFPQDDADRLFIKVTTPHGTALERTEAITADLERQLMRIAASDVEAVTARIGHQNTNSLDKAFGDADNEALIIAQFKRFGRSRTNAEWIELIPAQLRVPDGVDLVYQSEYFGPPTDQPVTVHVLSNDDAIRRGVAFEIESHLRGTPGVIEVEVDERPGTPQLQLNLNYEKLARLGLSAQDVGTTLAAAFYGIEASEHRDLDDTTEIRVQFDPGARLDLEALLETPVRAASGQLTRLRDVVEPMQLPAVTRI